MNVYVRAVCEELGRRGIPTEVFTRRSSPDGPSRVRLARRSWVNRLSVGAPEDLDRSRLFDLLPDFTDAVLAGAGEQTYQLIQSHYWLSGWVAARLRDAWGIPWFHSFHTLARVKNERAAEGSMPEPEHRIAVEQAIVRNADRLIASSAEEADDLVRLYGAARGRISVVPPGVDLGVFGPRPTAGLRERLGLAADQKVIVFAGRLERLKGTEIVIRATALLRRELGDLAPILVIIGDDSHNGASESRSSGGERARLQTLAASLGIAAGVKFVGSLEQPELAAYLSLAEVCVVPSYSESFGLVALEAAACGTPVVAARVGGLPAVVKDGLTGFTLLSHDPAQYAERISRLLQDVELRSCFSRRSRLVAAQYTWSATVDRLAAEYQIPQAPALRPAIAG